MTTATFELDVPKVMSVEFGVPTCFYTVGPKNPNSAKVIEAMKLRASSEILLRVCESAEEALSLAGDRSVVLVDKDAQVNYFSPTMTQVVPDLERWAKLSPWCVKVSSKGVSSSRGPAGIAHQVLAIFGKCFKARDLTTEMPWGPAKAGNSGPEVISLDPIKVQSLLEGLNRGPNLREAIADRAFALELPSDSRISWVRVPPAPIKFSRVTLQQTVGALRQFEQASHRLLQEDFTVKNTILSGVALSDPRLRNLYLDPGSSCFSIARPDLHWSAEGLSASENDEMPGGLPELVLLDWVYGLNQEQWTGFFNTLTAHGPLVFVVSAEWSKCYIPETTWLVSHLRSQGYDARIVTTDQLQDLSVTEEGVFHGSTKVGTIWRQFPIFETTGLLTELVIAARKGCVAMYPEFAHFGNKAWFSIFWQYQSWYRSQLSEADFARLQTIIPQTAVVVGDSSFPLQMGQRVIESASALSGLSEDVRNTLVLKVCGANTLAARSYGVLMGKGIKQGLWDKWISDRLDRLTPEPFLVQQMFNTGVVKIPVYNTKTKLAEQFKSRVLMRPWVFKGSVLSVHGCAVPSQYFKVHGMVSMAICPFELT